MKVKFVDCMGLSEQWAEVLTSAVKQVNSVARRQLKYK